MKNKLQKRPPTTSETDLIDEPVPEVGQWYWVGQEAGDEDDDGDEDGRWFGCVIHIGSNYVGLQSPPHGKHGSCRVERVHVDEFWDRCELEPDPDSVINGEIERYQKEVNRLMGRVKDVTARLAVAPSPELYSGSETQALAIRNEGDQDMDAYKSALVKAKKDELPGLFKEIEEANESLASWMSAKVIPLQAQAEGMRDVIATIEDRIFSVELYAGLTEQVIQVLDGEPAPIGAKVHLMQRRHYMDEECLAHYQAGGMEFADIGEFDQWLAKPENLKRILPFPRCIVSFRVRRERKEREIVSFADFINILGVEAADKATFLYIRNGEQLFCMRTELEFGEKLFPDLDKAQLDGGGKLWAKTFGSSIDGIITDNEYQGILEEHARRVKEFRVKKRAYNAALKTPEAKARAKAKGLKKPDTSCTDVPWPGHGWFSDPTEHYEPFNPDNVNYDDIAKKIADDIKQHNRIALVLQGLLDRSPVLHPHPPWQIWTNEGFEAALELIYDESRTLPAGPKPNFEKYRRRLNASLKVGSVTVGQKDAWERHEAEKECRRRASDWRDRSDYRPTHWTPYGNPGPGLVARVVRYGKRVRKCTYAWERERQTAHYRGDDSSIRTTFTTEATNVLNIDAYRPGDFHQFFDDPRTRADYLQWAPLLLAAEDYHAGKHSKLPKPPKPQPKKGSSFEGRRRYRQRKLREQLMGKTVRLTRQIKTQGGTTYEAGTLWKVTDGRGREFTLVGAGKDVGQCFIRCVGPDAFELVED